MHISQRTGFRRIAPQFAIAALWVSGGLGPTGFAQNSTDASDLSVASIRKALAAEHAAIAAHPNDGANYIDLAYTLTDAGMGNEASHAAAGATNAEPANALMYRAQGWVLHHNSIGVDYGSGFDYDGSMRALKHAIELDPKNLDARSSLANLLEFNRQGVRYAPDAELPQAIDLYRYVKEHEYPLKQDTADNLAIDLFYAGRYEEAVKELENLPGTNVHLGIILASLAASKGSPAAIQIAHSIQGDEQRSKDALRYAAQGLWNKRLYRQAADLLTASLPDTSAGPSISAQINIFRNLVPYSATPLPLTDPRRPVLHLLELALSGSLDQASATELISKSSYTSETALTLRETRHLEDVLLSLMKRTGLPRSVVADIILGNVTITVLSQSGKATPLQVQILGLASMHFFVIAEHGTWKIAAAGRDAEQVGAQASYLLSNHQVDMAQQLLDWYSSLLDRSAEVDDPLSGSLFLRFWERQQRSTPQAATLAAAALSTDRGFLKSALPDCIHSYEQATGEQQKADLELLLASIYLKLEDAPQATAFTTKLLKRSPDSPTATRLAGQCFTLQRDWSSWRALLAQQLTTHPNDRQFLIQDADEAVAEGNYARARELYQHLRMSAHSVPKDNAMYAWLSLYTGKPDEQAFYAAQTATLNSATPQYAFILTLACVNAARGNTAEAHQQLLDAMAAGNLAHPDAGIWYGFGKVFEQYGVLDAAVMAYKRSVADDDNSKTDKVEPGAHSASILAGLRLIELSQQGDSGAPELRNHD